MRKNQAEMLKMKASISQIQTTMDTRSNRRMLEMEDKIEKLLHTIIKKKINTCKYTNKKSAT
jgi:hypothetical protein